MVGIQLHSIIIWNVNYFTKSLYSGMDISTKNKTREPL